MKHLVKPLHIISLIAPTFLLTIALYAVIEYSSYRGFSLDYRPDLPSAFYTFLKLVICSSIIYLLVDRHYDVNSLQGILLIFIGLVFNPIAPLEFENAIPWFYIDSAALLLYIYLIYEFLYCLGVANRLVRNAANIIIEDIAQDILSVDETRVEQEDRSKRMYNIMRNKAFEEALAALKNNQSLSDAEFQVACNKFVHKWMSREIDDSPNSYPAKDYITKLHENNGLMKEL